MNTSILPESVLVANRGEIACRIFRSCRRLGIATVAVYSDADGKARHVREADHAVCIGPAAAAQSYLDPRRIVDAALSSATRAVHPGYGFLSERAELAEACTAAGLIWVGPRADVIRRMGSKIESKRIARAAGVPCVPGYEGDDQSAERLQHEAQAIGFPLLIKASAGGGGKGMRRVDSANGFAAHLQAAQQEALRAFGDSRVLLERLVPRPRHLEVQLAGDHHGGLIHLFERECSIQRHYQKLVEEAPAAHLPSTTRARLYDYALKLGREIAYDSLGTVEFILDTGSEQPYFLEMNTRLQVEHTVTEQVTGLDLVELQLRIAAGAPLGLPQPQIPSGWAIEARINCEDPADGFKPRPGIVRHYFEPAFDGLRIDSGVDAGAEVSPHYDSLAAKLIGYGASRATALRRLLRGLEQFEALGVGTNQGFLLDALRHPAFLSQPLHTAYLQETLGTRWSLPDTESIQAATAAAFASLQKAGTTTSSVDPWRRASAFRNLRRAGRRGYARLRLSSPERESQIDLALEPAGAEWSVEVDGATCTLGLRWLDPWHVEVAAEGGNPQRYGVEAVDEDTWAVTRLGQRQVFRIQSTLAAMAQAGDPREQHSGELRAQMPGIVTRVHVHEGQAVRAGEPLLEMEAMKLILQLTAPVDGIVSGLRCKPGDTLAQQQPLLDIRPAVAAVASAGPA